MRTLCAWLLAGVGLLAACGGSQEPFDPDKALRDPSLATLRAPKTFRVRFETTKGSFVVEVHRKWAPHGADRFYNLVRMNYFTDVAFFRVVKGFMVQFGMHGDPEINRAWARAFIRADVTRESNRRGRITFAQGKGGAGTRNVQVFINFVHNAHLDRDFTPFGEVIDGMPVVDSLYAGYGDEAPRGTGPAQGRLLFEGDAYLKQFPKLDYIRRAVLVE
ncbi:MAG: peptidylprolyl isomerase [Planctomycetota bacterium]|jgi:peptidyl-prolyl cis-trans isomerase A (cyclophilin A)